MDLNTNIPEDLDNLEKYAPHLAKIAKQNPFGVPEGYFDESNSILSAYAKISSLNKNSGFTVPASYFEELADRIQNKIFLENIKSGEVDVPEAYFDELPNIIQSRIFLESLNTENVFAVPENYFESLADAIQSRVLVEAIEKENTFAVPENYFETLPSRIEARIRSEKKETKIISLFRSNFSYVAAAASVAIIIAFTFFFNRDGGTKLFADTAVKHTIQITKQDIKEYLQANLDENALVEYASAKIDVDAKATVKTDDLEKSDVVNYLLENNVDVTEIQ